MLAVKGVFDGKKIELTRGSIPMEPQEVIVVFPDSDAAGIQENIYTALEHGHSFDFLKSEPDLYSDADLIEVYR